MLVDKLHFLLCLSSAQWVSCYLKFGISSAHRDISAFTWTWTMLRGWPWSDVWKGTFWTFAFLLGQKSVKPTLDTSSKLAFEISLYPLGRNCSVFCRPLPTLDSERAPKITVRGKMINENNSRAQVCVVICNWLSESQSLSPVSLTITELVIPPRCCCTEECGTWVDDATCPKT